MLRVTVEFVPHGDESRKREIGRMEIVNTADHEAVPVKGNYNAKVTTVDANGDIHVSTRRILDYERLRWNAWGLVYTVLKALGQYGMEGTSGESALGSPSE